MTDPQRVLTTCVEVEVSRGRVRDFAILLSDLVPQGIDMDEFYNVGAQHSFEQG
jgi:hypothetical protein